MPIKVIVELKATPGRRDELRGVLDAMLADIGPAVKEQGWLGGGFYDVVDEPDTLVEIADWESAAAREAVMNDPRTADVMGPVLELVAAPFKVTLLEAG